VSKLSLKGAFAQYNAELKNVRWASSAIAKDGSLVISCWHHFMKPYVDGHKRYEDHLSRWPPDHPGRALLSDHLGMATAGNLPVRLVIAKLDDPKQWISGEASNLRKTFSTQERLIGQVVLFDGDAFAIEFR